MLTNQSPSDTITVDQRGFSFMPKKLDRIGTTYERLTFTRYVGRNKHKQSLWEARCTCGGMWTGVVSLDVQSCGCLLNERIHAPKPHSPEHCQKISEAKRIKDTEHVCPVCGKTFMGTKLQRFCSVRPCQKKYFDCGNHRKKARLHGGKIEAVAFWKVYERDGGTCQICFLPAPRELRGSQTDKLAPELEHIIPLIHGGDHTYANVRLAHRGCNNEKADSLPEGFVRTYVNPDPRTRIEKIREETRKAMQRPEVRAKMLAGMAGRPPQKRMTVEERKAHSVLLKAYWSTRRASQSAITFPQA